MLELRVSAAKYTAGALECVPAFLHPRHCSRPELGRRPHSDVIRVVFNLPVRISRASGGATTLLGGAPTLFAPRVHGCRAASSWLVQATVKRSCLRTGRSFHHASAAACCSVATGSAPPCTRSTASDSVRLGTRSPRGQQRGCRSQSVTGCAALTRSGGMNAHDLGEGVVFVAVLGNQDRSDRTNIVFCI